MKITILRPVLLIIALAFVVNACSKYDEGPYFSLYSKEKRVMGRWYFTSVMYNDTDSTDVYRLDPMQTIEFYINPDKEAIWNAYTWNITSGSSGRVNYGMWRFNEEMDSLFMVTTLSLLPGNIVAEDTTRFDWRINRLAYTDLWVERMVGDTLVNTWKLWKLAY